MKLKCECGYEEENLYFGTFYQFRQCPKCKRPAQLLPSTGDVAGSYYNGWHKWNGEYWELIAQPGTHWPPEKSNESEC